MFSHNSPGIASKKMFDTQISPTIPLPLILPLTINTLPPESLRNKMERASNVDLSDILYSKYI